MLPRRHIFLFTVLGLEFQISFTMWKWHKWIVNNVFSSSTCIVYHRATPLPYIKIKRFSLQNRYISINQIIKKKLFLIVVSREVISLYKFCCFIFSNKRKKMYKVLSLHIMFKFGKDIQFNTPRTPKYFIVKISS